MEKRFTMEVATPRREVLVTQTPDAVLPGYDGEMEVFPGHRPLLTALRPGRLVCTDGLARRTFYVAGGFAEVLADRIVVLADECEEVVDIDLEEARQRLKEAETVLDEHRLLPADERAGYQLAAEQAEARVRLAAALAEH
jgi:F-type H+-transporting ATPase subunit epsilon